MQPTARNIEIQKLKLRGFKVITGHRNHYINKSGDVICITTGKLLKSQTRKQFVIIDGKQLSVPKLIMLVFSKIPYKINERVKFIDADKTNFHITNVKYVRLFKDGEHEINKIDLMLAIRCIFSVPKDYNVNNTLLTKSFIETIFEMRGQFITDRQAIKSIYSECLQQNIANVAKKYNMNIDDLYIIYKFYTNVMINRILRDFENGELQIIPFIRKKRTEKQALKEFREHSAQTLAKLNTV